MTTSPANPSSALEQGQIVTEWQRRYVVTGVLPSTLPTSPLVSQPDPQHLVALTSIEAEQAAIRARFADPQPRMFPVAVTFLVPERFDR